MTLAVRHTAAHAATTSAAGRLPGCSRYSAVSTHVPRFGSRAAEASRAGGYLGAQSSASGRPLQQPPCTAAGEPGPSDGGSGGGEDYAAMAASLNRLLKSRASLTGAELRALVVAKWGRSYEVRLHKRGPRMYVQIMWKFLEQQSFHMTADEYAAQLDAVADYLNEWGVADVVRAGIQGASARGPGYNHGGGAKAISIPLDVDLKGSRSSEFDA